MIMNDINKVLSYVTFMYKCKYIITSIHPQDKDSIDWSKVKNIVWQGTCKVDGFPPKYGEVRSFVNRQAVILETFENNDYIFCDRLQWDMLNLFKKEDLKEKVLFLGGAEADFVPTNLVRLAGLYDFKHYFVTGKAFPHYKVDCLPWGFSIELSRTGDWLNIDDVYSYLSKLDVNTKTENLWTGCRKHDNEDDTTSIRIKCLKRSGVYDSTHFYKRDITKGAEDSSTGDFLAYPEFLQKLATVRFTLIPNSSTLCVAVGDGPGIWESLYCNTIPIMPSWIIWKDFQKIFPIITVDDWSEVNPSNLTQTRYEDIMAQYGGDEWRKYLDLDYFFEHYVKGCLGNTNGTQ